MGLPFAGANVKLTLPLVDVVFAAQLRALVCVPVCAPVCVRECVTGLALRLIIVLTPLNLQQVAAMSASMTASPASHSISIARLQV